MANEIANLEAPGRAVLDNFLSETNSYRAQFAQILFDEYGEAIEESSGVVELAKPGKFRWEYQVPYRQIIVTDGQSLWVYDEDLQQVTISPVPESSIDSPLGLLVNGVNIDERYDIVPLERNDDLDWLTLKPKSVDNEYQIVELGVNDTTLVAMRLHDNLNQVTELIFSGAEMDPVISQQQFLFDIPPDVDVVNGVAE